MSDRASTGASFAGTPELQWHRTQFSYPSEKDFERGVVVVMRPPAGPWFVKGCEQNSFSTVNFGSPPQLWCHLDSLLHAAGAEMSSASICAQAEEVAPLRADAERYRWLRDNVDGDWAICEWSRDDPDGCGFYRDARSPHIVDAAVDAARAHLATKQENPDA